MVTALLVIDMIKDFVTGTLENERAKKIVPEIKQLIDSAHESDKPVIYISDSHSQDDSQFSLWGTHAVAGSEGSQVVSELEPEKEDYTLKKTKYSAFYNTELNSLLKDLNVNEVVLTGVLTHICIQHTAADAFFRGYDIAVPRECVEDLSAEENASALDFIEENYGAEIRTLSQITENW